MSLTLKQAMIRKMPNQFSFSIINYNVNYTNYLKILVKGKVFQTIMKTQADRDIQGKTSLHNTEFQPVILFTGKKTIRQNLNFQTKKFTARQPPPHPPRGRMKKKRHPIKK